MKLKYHSSSHFVNAEFKLKVIKGVVCNVLLQMAVYKTPNGTFSLDILDNTIIGLEIFGTECKTDFNSLEEARSSLAALGINLNSAISSTVDSIPELDLQNFCAEVLYFTRDNWSED